LCFNAHHEPIEFTLPPPEFGKAWQPVVDTSSGPGEIDDAAVVKAAGPVRIDSRAMLVLRASE
jgi:glycogen operon protein